MSSLLRFTLFFVYFTCFSSYALSPFEQLVESPTRPTVNEILEAYGESDPSKLPIITNFNRENNNLINAIYSHIPAYIAQLEKTYPNATWVVIGRDVAALGDLLDAFYLSLGQKGRVHRLDISKETLAHIDDTLKGPAIDQTLVRFLSSNGLNLDPKKSSKPWIMIDTTTHRTTSQGYRLMKTAYQYYSNRGGNPIELIHNFNLVSLQASGTALNLSTDLPKFFAKQSVLVMTYGFPNEISFLQDGEIFARTLEWHKPFGELEHRSTGIMGGKVGNIAPRESRVRILSQQLEIIKHATSPKFLELVKLQCQVVGFNFGETFKTEPSDLKVLSEVLETGTQLKRDNQKQQTDPVTIHTLLGWLNHATDALQSDAPVLVFINKILKLQEAKRLTRFEFGHLFQIALTKAKPTRYFRNRLATLSKKYPIIEEVLALDYSRLSRCIEELLSDS